ncbi:uncharacterized protein [Halyomorpha halys]|uniref:uncharacterized protein n=1 Tax=Halyomorpha halys TaxID=286706 RepID=UPI0006D50E19|nr:uncharacterized protein LOC106679571 [Halyomorpha halys]
MVAKGRTRFRKEEDEESEPWTFAFCFFFTNQAGTVIFSFSGFALMITTMLLHWYAPSLTSAGVRALQNVLLHLYLFIMLAGFIIAFVSAYFEKGVLAKVAALLVLIGTVLYIIFFIMSFLTETMLMIYVCPEMRCPDHHWLQDSSWRGYVLYSENVARYRNLEKERKELEEKIKLAIQKESERLQLIEINNSNSDGFLQEFLPNSKIYPEMKKTCNSPLNLNATTLTVPKYSECDLVQMEESKLQHVRVVPDDENVGGSFLIVVSILFGIFIIAYFAYAIVTFFAFGMYLSNLQKE